MEHNRYNQNSRFHRDHHRKPYDRGPPHYNRRFPERQYYGGYSRPTNRRDNISRTFDNRGREVYENQWPLQRNNHSEDQNHTVVPQLTPLEKKTKSFLQTVLNQEGIRSKLMFMETVDNSVQTLQGTVDYFHMQMVIEQNNTGEYVLSIDKEELAKGTFPNRQVAKTALAQEALDVLRKDCFYIIKKKEYEEVSTKTNPDQEQSSTQSTFEGSKAHQMMLKMGWGGKGLGINEQGVEKTVAESIDQNVSRQGLGTDDVFKKIQKILEDYSKSEKMSLLRFDPDFTSEERAHIHKIAQRFGLKSKSEGKGDQRRITVTKKLHRGDLVYNLLTCGLENSLYKLIIPSKFEQVWLEKDNDEDGFHPQFTN